MHRLEAEELRFIMRGRDYFSFSNALHCKFSGCSCEKLSQLKSANCVDASMSMQKGCHLGLGEGFELPGAQAARGIA